MPSLLRCATSLHAPDNLSLNWTGTDALIYDLLLIQMSATGENELPQTSHWFKAVSKNTLSNTEQTLEETGFIRLKNSKKKRVIEILNPETSLSMPQKGADQRTAGSRLLRRQEHRETQPTQRGDFHSRNV